MKLGRSSPYYGKLRVKELDPEVYRIWLTRDQELAESPSWLTSHHYEYDMESELVLQDLIVKLLSMAGLKTNQSKAISMLANGATLQDIGDEIGTTRERARQILNKAFRKIREQHVEMGA